MNFLGTECDPQSEEADKWPPELWDGVQLMEEGGTLLAVSIETVRRQITSDRYIMEGRGFGWKLCSCNRDTANYP
jgi:hypothetical protein